MIYYALAQLSEERLETIRALEKDLGKRVVAFAPTPIEPAPLDQTALDKLRSAEQRLGVVLVAVS